MAALTWTFQTSVFNKADGGTAANNSLMLAAAASSRGVVLAVNINTSNSAVSIYRSTNGGTAWTLVNHGSITWGGDMSLVWGGGTNWYIVAAAGQYFYSSNDGSTWTSGSTGAMAPQCNNSVAYDGSSTIIFQGASGGKTEWITASGTQPPTVNNADFGVGNVGAPPGGGTILWDGTNFVAINDDTGGANYKLMTAPSGFAQGAGPSWTVQQTFAIGSPALTNGALGQPCFAFLPGVGYMTAWSSGGLKLATAYASILSTTGLQTPLGSSSTYFIYAVGTRFLAGNNNGALVESTDGVTWTADAPNFAVTGEKIAMAVYDSLHNTYLIFGSAGSVCLGQVQAPFGRGLPASSPGVLLTPNSNVNAPAGIGGDRWGANGGGITPVGGGVTGQTGYDKPIKITVSDGERAANYIISGGQNVPGAPVSVIGGEGNATLSGQTIDSTLPQGDSTLGTVG